MPTALTVKARYCSSPDPLGDYLPAVGKIIPGAATDSATSRPFCSMMSSNSAGVRVSLPQRSRVCVACLAFLDFVGRCRPMEYAWRQRALRSSGLRVEIPRPIILTPPLFEVQGRT